MKMKRILLLVAALAAAVALFSCGDPTGNDDDDSGVDYSNHYTDSSYSILVRNETSEKLVAFKKTLSLDAVIGGIPAKANNHGLPKNAALFSASETFDMILITEEQFKANKNNLMALSGLTLASVSVSYNHGGDNSTVYEISEISK